MPTLRSLLIVVLLITPAIAAAQARPRIMAARAEGVEPGVSGSGFQGVPTRNRDAEFRAVRPAPKP